MNPYFLKIGTCICDIPSTTVFFISFLAALSHGSLPTARGTVSVLPTGLLVIQNLETAIPDNFRAPPSPLPFSMGSDSSETLSRGSESVDSLNKTCYPKAAEDKSSILNIYNTSATEEEDVCPTCLEEYDADNPRIIPKCQHHFHLSCIFEWMERSATCPICDQLMVINQTYNG
ncbi:unnamed protein product [Spirodela intermedia]|uniref:RING-type E3 ubiquitin transferase n=1 Tax=Spirodela intermedia TaxID=51605 RepID=A0A7I8IX72_SPIIN|nr:unnamed protein product [Spirodela intermedia]CAA6662606.1 unnamed protein product [Spirodela intermedia]